MNEKKEKEWKEFQERVKQINVERDQLGVYIFTPIINVYEKEDGTSVLY